MYVYTYISYACIGILQYSVINKHIRTLCGSAITSGAAMVVKTYLVQSCSSLSHPVTKQFTTTYLYTYVCTYIHTCMHTRTHTYLHTLSCIYIHTQEYTWMSWNADHYPLFHFHMSQKNQTETQSVHCCHPWVLLSVREYDSWLDKHPLFYLMLLHKVCMMAIGRAAVE